MDTPLYRAAQYLAAENNGDSRRGDRLYAWATERPEDTRMAHMMSRALWVVAGLLLGAGLIFWVAANWQDWARMTKLALIQLALLGAVGAACVFPGARKAALLAATLALGGLLAYIGQTYQTGADAWQLFAAWAALSLIWVGAARSDLLWTVWVLIAALALALWTGPLGLWGRLFAMHEQHLSWSLLSMGAWLALALVPMAVATVPALRPAGGWGRWSHRVATALALGAWVAPGVFSLFTSERISVTLVAAGLLVAGTLWLSLKGKWRDLTALGLAVAAANVLVMGLVARAVLSQFRETEGLLLVGLVGMACLGFSATWFLRQQQTWSQGEPA